MVVLQVTVQVQPDRFAEFLEVVRYDAEQSLKEEPGCLRFDVIQDRDDPARLYFYEVYRDEAALQAHRETLHFKLYVEKARPCLAGAPEHRLGTNLIPADDAWR